MELPGASVVFQVPAIPKWVPRPITENAGQHPFAKHPMNDHYPDPGWCALSTQAEIRRLGTSVL